MDRLSSAQERLLEDLLAKHGVGAAASRFFDSDLTELADAGFLRNFTCYYDGRATFEVSGKAASYFEEIERSEQEAQSAARHDWAVNGFNAVVALVAAVIGGIIGYMLGKL